MRRKIIQIAPVCVTGYGTPVDEVFQPPEEVLYALCDDGTVWVFRQYIGSWQKFPSPVPVEQTR